MSVRCGGACTAIVAVVMGCGSGVTRAGSRPTHLIEQGDSPLRRAFARALAAPRPPRDLRVEAECGTRSGYQSVRLYGAGVGVWRDRAQFAIDDERLAALLRAFSRHRFFELRETYGGRVAAPEGGGEQGVRATCAVTLSLAGEERRVVQLQGGEQSRELVALAHRILQICAETARHMITTPSIADGLSKIIQGELAPEMLVVVGHFKPLHGAGWLLEVRGAQVRSRSFDRQKGYDTSRALTASSDEVQALARALLDGGVSTLANRLAAEDYTELRVQVLDQAVEIQARPFAGASAPSPAEREALTQLRSTLEQLHEQVMQCGVPVLEP